VVSSGTRVDTGDSSSQVLLNEHPGAWHLSILFTIAVALQDHQPKGFRQRLLAQERPAEKRLHDERGPHVGLGLFADRRTPGCLAPIYLRLSVTDWVEGGVTLDESIELIRQLKTAGLDMIDVSHGMVTPNVDVPWAPGMMIAPAGRIRREANTARPICAWGVALASASQELWIGGWAATSVSLQKISESVNVPL